MRLMSGGTVAVGAARVRLPALLRWLLQSMSKRPSRPPAPNGQAPAMPRSKGRFSRLRMQRPNEAELLAAGVLKSDRGNIVAAQVLGRALMVQGRPAEAIVVLERTVRRSSDPAIETLLAGALAAAGRGDDALEQLRKTTARRPPFPPAFLEHGGQLSRLGRLDEAVAVLESGLALAPEMRRPAHGAWLCSAQTQRAREGPRPVPAGTRSDARAARRAAGAGQGDGPGRRICRRRRPLSARAWRRVPTMS